MIHRAGSSRTLYSERAKFVNWLFNFQLLYLSIDLGNEVSVESLTVKATCHIVSS